MRCSGSLGEDNEDALGGEINFYTPSASINHHFAGELAHMDEIDIGVLSEFHGTYVGTTNAVDGVQLKMSSGKLAAGTVTLYGLSA